MKQTYGKTLAMHLLCLFMRECIYRAFLLYNGI